MPKRFCSCLGCPACASPDRKPGSHGTLFDADTTGTLRCPSCQPIATQKRQQRTSSTSRGYGASHRATRARLLAAFEPGQPCAHCGRPMMTKQGLDLAHTDDRTGYRGLAHAECNRGNR